LFDALKEFRSQASPFDAHREASEIEIEIAALGMVAEPDQVSIGEAGLLPVPKLELQEVVVDSVAAEEREKLVLFRFGRGWRGSLSALLQDFLDRIRCQLLPSFPDSWSCSLLLGLRRLLVRRAVAGFALLHTMAAGLFSRALREPFRLPVLLEGFDLPFHSAGRFSEMLARSFDGARSAFGATWRGGFGRFFRRLHSFRCGDFLFRRRGEFGRPQETPASRLRAGRLLFNGTAMSF
jgi:hypothetical protein